MLTLLAVGFILLQSVGGNISTGGAIVAGGSPPTPQVSSLTISSDGYSDTGLNIVSPITNSLATCGTTQYAPYITVDLGLTIVKRNLTTNATTAYVTGFTIDDDDEHKYASIACDKNGYLHLWYGMHASALIYRKSTAPNDPSAFSDLLPMLGTHESSVTYPMAFTNPTSGELYFTFRDGVSSNGDQYFYHYDATGAAWEAASGSGSGGMIINGKVTPVSAYLNGLPCWDSAGNLWWSWSWGVGGTPAGIANEYLMKWTGSAFKKANGSAQTIPATDSNLTVLKTIDVSTLLTAQNHFCVTANDTVVIAYAHNDGSGHQQIYALENSSGSFVEHTLTNNAFTYLFQFNVTAVSRGSATYVLYSEIYGHHGISVWKTTDNFTTAAQGLVTTDFNPNFSINPDAVRLRSGILSFTFQHSNDPVYGVPDPNAGPTIKILEWIL